MRPTVCTLEQVSGRGSLARALVVLVLAGAFAVAFALSPNGVARAASQPSPDPAPQVQPDPEPQSAPAGPAQQQAPRYTLPARTVRTSQGALSRRTAPAAPAGASRHSSPVRHRGHRRSTRAAHSSGTARHAARVVPPSFAGLRLTGLPGLEQTFPSGRTDGWALLFAAVALLLLVTAAGSLLRMTLGLPGRSLR
jgi:hypothetical protein